MGYVRHQPVFLLVWVTIFHWGIIDHFLHGLPAWWLAGSWDVCYSQCLSGRSAPLLQRTGSSRNTPTICVNELLFNLTWATFKGHSHTTFKAWLTSANVSNDTFSQILAQACDRSGTRGGHIRPADKDDLRSQKRNSEKGLVLGWELASFLLFFDRASILFYHLGI